MLQLGAFFLPALPLAALLLGRYRGHEAIVRLSERIAARSCDAPAPPRANGPRARPVALPPAVC